METPWKTLFCFIFDDVMEIQGNTMQFFSFMNYFSAVATAVYIQLPSTNDDGSSLDKLMSH